MLKELEQLQKEGLIRSIGVSNFNIEQVDRVLRESEVKPSVVQIEIHPYFTQEPLVEYCQKNGIVVTAYSPFSSPDSPWFINIRFIKKKISIYFIKISIYSSIWFKFFQLHIPPMEALLFPDRLRPGKRSASIGRRFYIYSALKYVRCKLYIPINNSV